MTSIYVLYLLLSALVVFLMFYSTISGFYKSITLSVLVLVGVVTRDHYVSQLGKPITGFPAYEFVYVHHVSRGDTILIWVWSEDSGNKLYSFPYSQALAEELEQAKKKAEQEGDSPSGKFTDSRGDGSIHLETGSWVGSSTERTK